MIKYILILYKKKIDIFYINIFKKMCFPTQPKCKCETSKSSGLVSLMWVLAMRTRNTELMRFLVQLVGSCFKGTQEKFLRGT